MLKRKKVIIDTDPGVDDAFALFYAVTHPQLEVLGITTTFGNVPTPLAAINARYLMKRFGQSHIPVAEGSHKPYKRPQSLCADFVHGKDGLGNTFQVEEVGQNDPRPAHVMMCDIIRANPGEVTIIAIAPLVNLALALDHDPGIAALVKEVVVMGGAIHCNGNINPAAEANTFNDPEAAEKVFHASWPVVLFPLDVTDHGLMPTSHVEDLTAYGEMGEYLCNMSKFYQDFYRRTREHNGVPVEGMVIHDLHPVMYLIYPEYFRFRSGGLHVMGGEDRLRGHIIMDDRTKWSHPHAWTDLPSVKVCFAVDHQSMFRAFEDRLKAFSLASQSSEVIA
jgi:inosine-uridine nucleoside N-ribohydrolase